jgi:plasmid stabilization system protein ParE
MARRVVWSPRALADVEAIAAYIASDSPAYASAVVKRIINTTRNLSQFPNSGPASSRISRHIHPRIVCLQLSHHLQGERRGNIDRNRNSRQKKSALMQQDLIEPGAGLSRAVFPVSF